MKKRFAYTLAISEVSYRVRKNDILNTIPFQWHVRFLRNTTKHHKPQHTPQKSREKTPQPHTPSPFPNKFLREDVTCDFSINVDSRKDTFLELFDLVACYAIREAGVRG